VRRSILQDRLLGFIRFVFYAFIVVAVGFLSCLTAMRFAIRGSEVVVPQVVGQTLPEASNALTPAQLQIKVEGYRFDPQVLQDRIISQLPSPNSRLKIHQHVRVIVSLGAKKIPIPDLKGETVRAAQITLLSRGLNLGGTAQLNSEDVESDKIISQDPLPQNPNAQSPIVNLLVSSGKKRKSFYLPDLAGMDIAEVSTMAQAVDISVAKINYQSVAGISRGTILHQSRSAGSVLREGDVLELEVAK
jgi:eukaryotic-like serine/threonine-protein kinase